MTKKGENPGRDFSDGVRRLPAVPFLDSPSPVVHVESLNEGSTAVQSLLLGHVLFFFGGAFCLVGLVAVETLEAGGKGGFPVESHQAGYWLMPYKTFASLPPVRGARGRIQNYENLTFVTKI